MCHNDYLGYSESPTWFTSVQCRILPGYGEAYRKATSTPQFRGMEDKDVSSFQTGLRQDFWILFPWLLLVTPLLWLCTTLLWSWVILQGLNWLWKEKALAKVNFPYTTQILIPVSSEFLNKDGVFECHLSREWKLHLVNSHTTTLSLRFWWRRA